MKEKCEFVVFRMKTREGRDIVGAKFQLGVDFAVIAFCLNHLSIMRVDVRLTKQRTRLAGVTFQK